jgi:branched-chain amino acid transport system permease protein
MRSLSSGLIWALWIALLVFPFGGLELAGYIGAAIAVGAVLVFLWHQTPAAVWAGKVATTVSNFWRVGSERIARSGPAAKYSPSLLLLIAVIAIPLLFANRYQADVLTNITIYIVLAIGLDTIVGVTGLLCLGYIAFYAVGAYTYALLSMHYHLNFFLALPAAGILAFVTGFLLGLPVLRLRGDYLAIVTLGFGEITRITLNNLDEFTGGPNGIMNIARPNLFGMAFNHPIYYYCLGLVFVLGAIFIRRRLLNSRFGRALEAIREDEIAARSIGINVTRYKLQAFAIGAAFAGIAGAFFASKMTHVSPESFTFLESVMVLCMVVLGGMGSLPGVIMGAIILILLPELLRSLELYRMLIFGGLMVVIMLFRPQGLIPGKRLKRSLELEQSVARAVEP